MLTRWDTAHLQSPTRSTRAPRLFSTQDSPRRCTGPPLHREGKCNIQAHTLNEKTTCEGISKKEGVREYRFPPRSSAFSVTTAEPTHTITNTAAKTRAFWSSGAFQLRILRACVSAARNPLAYIERNKHRIKGPQRSPERDMSPSANTVLTVPAKLLDASTVREGDET